MFLSEPDIIRRAQLEAVKIYLPSSCPLRFDGERCCIDADTSIRWLSESNTDVVVHIAPEFPTWNHPNRQLI